MYQYTYVKLVNSDRLTQEILTAGLSTIHHIDTAGPTVLIYFNAQLSEFQKSTLDTVVSSHILTTTREQIDAIIDGALTFGNKITRDFVAENVMLGITQRGLTKHVRTMFKEVKDAIQTGSLYDAISEIRALDPNDFDNVVITPARVLLFRNKIETYLGVPLAQQWDEEETWL